MSSWRPPGPPGDHQAGGPGYSGHNRQPSHGGPNAIQRSTAAQLHEPEALFTTYEHLSGLPRGDSALTMLRHIASVVKPIMRKRGWKVSVLAEFLPPEQNLLGLNINKGYKICIRLRYHHNPDLFLPFEQCVDTMLHELSHNVWGAHDSNFHKLWDALRDEHEVLLRKGYTGEGFLGSGNRLGGSTGLGGGGRHQLPTQEVRRLARVSAEKRRQQGTLGNGSGQRLGGAPIHHVSGGKDIRTVIADQVAKRNNNNKTMDRGGCASGRQDAGRLSQQSSDSTFKTKAEEDDANNRAIAQALFELMEQEEEQKLNGTFAGSKAGGGGGLGWSQENGLYDAGEGSSSRGAEGGQHPSEDDQLKWAVEESLRACLETSGGIPYPKEANRATLAAKMSSSPIEDRTIASPPGSPRPSNARSSPNSESGTLVDATPARKRPASALGPSPAKPLNPSLRQGLSGIDVKTTSSSIDLARSPKLPMRPARQPQPVLDERHPTTEQWTCEICTCINPLQFLTCDACGVERPQSLLVNEKPAKSRVANSTTAQRSSREPNTRPLPTMTAAERFPVKALDPTSRLGWNCGFCGSFMEHKWWTCSACGMLKDRS